MKEETSIESIDLIEIKRNVHDGHHSLYVEYLCIVEAKGMTFKEYIKDPQKDPDRIIKDYLNINQ